MQICAITQNRTATVIRRRLTGVICMIILWSYTVGCYSHRSFAASGPGAWNRLSSHFWESYIDSLTYLTYCHCDSDVVTARWQPKCRTMFLNRVLCVASCEASCTAHDVHFRTVVTRFRCCPATFSLVFLRGDDHVSIYARAHVGKPYRSL